MAVEFQQVKEIFLAAVDKGDLAERDAWLRSKCADDEPLRRQIEALLRRHDEAGEFLERPATELDGFDAHAHFRRRILAPGDAVGATLGPYQLSEPLGEGGMGTVYLAEQQHPVRRQVALKVIRAGMDTAQVIARFEQERQALALMDHPHIAKVLDAGTTDSDLPYFVMELVKGVPITQYCDRERLTPRERLQLFIPVCQAVQHAHQKGIIHRDLKPSNVLVAAYDGKPVPKVIDFGVAKATSRTLAERTLHTEAGVMVGTLEYMAPEQAELANLDIDTRADIYSLGVLLYELLTGSTPFSAKELRRGGFSEMLKRIKEIEPAKPSSKLSSSGELRSVADNRRLEPAQLTKQVKGELDWIVMKCLEKERSRRYETANGLSTDLRRYLADEAVTAGPPAATYRLRKFLSRNKGPLAAAVAIVGLLVCGTVISTLLAYWATKERDRARLELGNSLVAQAAALQGTGQIGQRFESLRLLGAAARELRNHPQGRERLPDIRNHAIAAFGLSDVKVAWERSVGNVTGSHFDAELERYTMIDYAKTGQISVRRVDDDQELLTLPRPGATFWYANTDFSSDGQYVLACYWLGVGNGALLNVWHIDRMELLLSQHINPETNVWLVATFHPNGRWLVFAHPESALVVWDLVERREVRRIALNENAHSVVLDPTGKQVAVTESKAGRIRVLDLDSGFEHSAWKSENGVGLLAWSADSQLIACGGIWGRVGIWHVARAEMLALLQGHTSEIIHLQFAHKGHLLATTSWDRTTRLWDAVSGESLAAAPAAFRRFSTDDSRLAFLDGTKIGVWGDSRLLATSENSGARLWDVVTGTQRAHLEMGITHPVLFHPDGRAIVTHGLQGTHRWPVQVVSDPSEERVQIGPPELLPIVLPSKEGSSDAKWMPGHGALAVNDRTKSRILIYDLTQPNAAAVETAELKSQHDNVISISVSPDGQWLAAGAWKRPGVQVWNIPERRRLSAVLRPDNAPADLAFLAAFSPDGRWLVSATNDEGGLLHGYHFWRTGTWEYERFIPAKICWPIVAFANDGKLMAMSVSPQQILLADPATGGEYARLSTIQPIGPFPAAFSPDGSKLAAITGRRTVLIWDLGRIRQRLAEMDLDWGAPALGAQPATQRPLRVEVIGAVPEPPQAENP